jgi:cytochrome c oxidase cbb3-type subunit II
MKREITEFKLVIGALTILGIAVVVLVGLPYLILRDVTPPAALKPYTAQQLRGRAVYVSNGCIYCHSQQPRDPAQAPDASRGWGRPSVAADYAYDKPHLLGTSRTGPDLFNIGARQPSEDWHLGHLYQPRAYTQGSIMPAFPFLFAVHPGSPAPAEKVINLPPQYARAGMTVAATQEAIDLAAYLISLDHTYPVLSASDVQP